MARGTRKVKRDTREENDNIVTLNFINKTERQLKGLWELFKGEWTSFHADICEEKPMKFGGHITVDKAAHDKKWGKRRKARR